MVDEVACCPYRCGLLLLLAWQLLPLLSTLRHSLPLYSHYFIITMPGQFILMSLALASIVAWFSEA